MLQGKLTDWKAHCFNWFGSALFYIEKFCCTFFTKRASLNMLLPELDPTPAASATALAAAAL
jgi:hypothetical protein